jgi:aspartate oxidase
MVRLFETRRNYNERMKRRSNLLTSNAKLRKLINDYRNLQNRIKKGIYHLPNRNNIHQKSRNMSNAIVKNAQTLISSKGANARHNFPFNNSPWRKLNKILAAVPNTRPIRHIPPKPPKYVLVNQPNGNIGLGRVRRVN